MKPKKNSSQFNANPACVLSNADGECIGVVKAKVGSIACGSGACPFFKTSAQQARDEKRAQERCKRTGFEYQDRDAINAVIEARAKYYATRKGAQNG